MERGEYGSKEKQYRSEAKETGNFWNSGGTLGLLLVRYV